MSWTRPADAGTSAEPGRALHAAAGPPADTGTGSPGHRHAKELSWARRLLDGVKDTHRRSP
jgi:hypothetical protein